MHVQELNKTARDDVYRRTLAAVRAEADHVNLAGLCLDWAWHGYRILKLWPSAPRTILQAGSARWPRVPPELDDGVSPTHFSYEWDAESEEARLIRSGIARMVRRADGRTGFSLPEMHVWLACPDTQEIVDFTTGLWPAACKATLGQEWLASPPPDYLWAFVSPLPEGVSYRPDRAAIDCVIALLHAQGRQYP
jgi:hypothetical protein